MALLALSSRARGLQAGGLCLLLVALGCGRDPRVDPPPVPPVATEGRAGFPAGEMLERLRSRVTQQPDNATAWGEYGMALARLDQWHVARKALEVAQRLEPDDPRWAYYLARSLEHLDIHQALPAWRHAVGLDGETTTLQIRLGNALVQAGRLEEAMQCFERLLRRKSGHAGAHLGLGRVSLLRGRAERAVEHLSQCLENPRTRSEAHRLLAAALGHLQRPAAAEAAAQRAGSLPEDLPWPDPYWELSQSYRIDRQAHLERCHALLQQGRVQELESALLQLTRQWPEEPEGWLMLARLRLDAGQCAEAHRWVRRHLQLKPDSVNGQFLLGLTHLCQNQFREAADALQEVLGLKPDFAEARFNLAMAQLNLQEARAAMASLRQVIELSPDMLEAYVLLADLLIQTGRHDEAGPVLEQARRLAPADPRVADLQRRLEDK